MKNLKGNKKRGTHSTAIELAERLVLAIQKNPLITGIQLGQIKTGAKANGIHRIKIERTNLGLKLQIKEGQAVQIVYIYTKEHDKACEIISESAKELHAEVVLRNG